MGAKASACWPEVGLGNMGLIQGSVTQFLRGDLVRIPLLRDEKAQRVVWGVLESTVLGFPPVAYDAALKSGRKPRTIVYREWALKPA